MHGRVMIAAVIPLGLLYVSSFMVSAQDQMWFEAHMHGGGVVPPTSSHGEGDLVSERSDWPCGGQLQPLLFTVTYDSLIGSPTSASIYRGAYDANGTVAYDLFPGYFASGSSVPLGINTNDCGDVTMGRMYAVIRTDTFPDGEVRGMVEIGITSVLHRTWGHIRAQFR